MSDEVQPSSQGPEVTRRGFVAGVTAAAISLPLAAARADDDDDDDDRKHRRPKERVDNQIVPTRKIADVEDGTINTNYAAKYGFLLVRKDNAIYAIDTTCTHQGCEITPGAADFHCECHGARYDVLGNVTHKPARKALARFALYINKDGVIEVNTGKKVDHDSPEGVIHVAAAPKS